MSEENEDYIVLTSQDLLPCSCNASTKRGKKCLNRLHKNSSYCKLHHKQFSLEKPEDCPVCMEKLLPKDYPLKCGHWVHKNCLLKWKENICPICRTEIKLSKRDQQRKDKYHNKINEEEYVEIPPQILELIESLLRGIPEYMREEFVSGLLHVDIERNSILVGNDSDEYEEFSQVEIEEFPDYIE